MKTGTRARFTLSRLVLAIAVVFALFALPKISYAALPQQSGSVDLLTQANLHIDGAATNDQSGNAVGDAGDVNGDHVDDVIIGVKNASYNGRNLSGSAYVVFGSASETSIDLGALGSKGFRIDGAAANAETGTSVAGSGDFNGDGLDDVIVGAPFRSTGSFTSNGAAYVVFGKASTTTVDLNSLGSDGFRMDGTGNGSRAGKSVDGVGDMNSDGRDDVIVGASADIGSAGKSYVVFGRSSSEAIDFSSFGTNGFEIDGAAAGDGAGIAVSGVGDFNADGRPDVAVGAFGADNNTRANSGSSYVVFGKTSTSTVDLAAPGNAFLRIDGAAAGDTLGRAASGAGDVNGDGLTDVVLGAPSASSNTGVAYVVLGRTGTSTIDLSSFSSGGFQIGGADANTQFGDAVAGVGDINGDGRDDVAIGSYASLNGRTNSGASRIVFGRTEVSTVDVSTLGSSGIVIAGPSENALAGIAVAGGGDVNGDGRPDVVTGAAGASNNGRGSSGSTYVTYGFGTPEVSYSPSSITGTVGSTISPVTPSVKRTGTASFSVFPALPAGLSLDSDTGKIFGTPTAATPAGVYHVTMSDLAGSSTTDVTITVNGLSTPPTTTTTTPPPSVKCVVPKLKKLTLKAAKKRLKAAHCRAGKTKKRRVARHSKYLRRVISQGLKAGSVKPEGTKVRLTIGKKAKHKKKHHKKKKH